MQRGDAFDRGDGFRGPSSVFEVGGERLLLVSGHRIDHVDTNVAIG
ncbi:hypothetical protein [Haladaptatus halobius]|nr:hypothetical protein [Haladaptatus halobius]